MIKINLLMKLKIMNKTALITGSNGFVGQYLSKELIGRGYKVFGVGCEKKENKNYYCADITNKDLLESVVESTKPGYVFHLAGISSTGLANSDPKRTYDVNVGGTRNLLDILLKYPDTKVLIVSSSHVYGRPQSVPVKESNPLNGKGVYAESRIKQEALVEGYIDKMNIVITRSFNHTGPAQNDTFVIPKIMSQIVQIKKGKADSIELGDINVKRDISDVRDVVKAYVMLLEQENFGRTVNVCRGESISLKDVIGCGKKFAELEEVEVKVNPEFVREDNVVDIYGDNSELKKLIDWKSTISYEAMLQDIFNYWNKI